MPMIKEGSFSCFVFCFNLHCQVSEIYSLRCTGKKKCNKTSRKQLEWCRASWMALFNRIAIECGELLLVRGVILPSFPTPGVNTGRYRYLVLVLLPPCAC